MWKEISSMQVCQSRERGQLIMKWNHEGNIRHQQSLCRSMNLIQVQINTIESCPSRGSGSDLNIVTLPWITEILATLNSHLEKPLTVCHSREKKQWKVFLRYFAIIHSNLRLKKLTRCDLLALWKFASQGRVIAFMNCKDLANRFFRLDSSELVNWPCQVQVHSLKVWLFLFWSNTTRRKYDQHWPSEL